MNQPGYFETDPDERPEQPDEYRHPCGVLIQFGHDVDNDGRRAYRSLHTIMDANLNVGMVRRTLAGPVGIEVQGVRANLVEGWIEVRGFWDENYTADGMDVTRVPLSEVVSLEVW